MLRCPKPYSVLFSIYPQTLSYFIQSHSFKIKWLSWWLPKLSIFIPVINSMSVSHQINTVLKSNPNVIVLGGDWVFRVEPTYCPFMKRPEVHLTLHLPCENISQRSAIWKRVLTRTQLCCTLISDLQPPQFWEINTHWLSHLVSGSLL